MASIFAETFAQDGAGVFDEMPSPSPTDRPSSASSARFYGGSPAAREWPPPASGARIVAPITSGPTVGLLARVWNYADGGEYVAAAAGL